MLVQSASCPRARSEVRACSLRIYWIVDCVHTVPTVVRLNERVPDLHQSGEGLEAFTSLGMGTPGLVICCERVGRFLGGLISTVTGAAVRAERYRASMIFASIRPSRPEGSGSLFCRMESEK